MSGPERRGTRTGDDAGPGVDPAADDPPRTDPVAPSRDDPLVAWLSGVVGGPAGRWVRAGAGFWTVQRVLLAMVCGAFALALLQKAPCHASAWPRAEIDTWLCYSDIPHMFRERGFSLGATPYFDTGAYPPLEYPVLIGFVMWVTAGVARTASSIDAGAVRFFDLTSVVLLAAAIATVLVTARLAGRRPWDAAMIALAPVLVLSGLINWDLLALALSTGALLAWARRRPVLAGVLIGLGMATKLYPLLLLGPLLVLCVRTGRMAEFWRTTGAAAAAFAVVNAPVLLGARDGWLTFWSFNDDRGADFGSIWYVFSLAGRGVPADRLDALIVGLFVAACVGIAWLGLKAPRRPRLVALAFLTVAAFVLVNKVYSPQYALWLLPLAVLARPRWRDFLAWQAGEVLYWIAIWLHLSGYLQDGTALRFYYLAVFAHIGATLWLVAMVVRDILRPELDPVRATGEDDPSFPWAEDPRATAADVAEDSPLIGTR